MIQSPVEGGAPAGIITSSTRGNPTVEGKASVTKESPVEKASPAEVEPPIARRSLTERESPAVKEPPARHDSPIEEEPPANREFLAERDSLAREESPVEKNSTTRQESPIGRESLVQEDLTTQQESPAENGPVSEKESSVETELQVKKESSIEKEPEVETEPSVQQESPVQKQPPVERESSAERDESAPPGHESMVTVRLSEPPSLVVDTDLPSAIPTRRSIFGPEYTPTPTPTSAKPSSLRSEDRIDEVDEEDEDLMLGNTVAASTGKAAPREGDEEANARTSSLRETVAGRQNLQQELEDAPCDEETKGPGSSSSRRGSVDSDSEDEVNWDALQKKEDEQAQDQQDDNVSPLSLRCRPTFLFQTFDGDRTDGCTRATFARALTAY